MEYNTVGIEVPESWDDITLGFYETLYTEKPGTARERAALAAKICKVDADLLLSWPAEVFNRIVGYIDFLFRDNPAPPSPVVGAGGVNYIVPIEDELSLGAWVDADDVQKKGENVLSNILAIVCRPAGEAYDHKNNEARQAMFAALPVSRVLGALAFFFTLQNRVRSTYSGLYETDPGIRPAAPEYKAFSKSWGWYKIIADLADNKVSGFDAITTLPVTEIFTFLQYRKNKDYAETAQRRLDQFIAKHSKNANS
jgi:hypothetical protein